MQINVIQMYPFLEIIWTKLKIYFVECSEFMSTFITATFHYFVILIFGINFNSVFVILFSLSTNLTLFHRKTSAPFTTSSNNSHRIFAVFGIPKNSPLGTKELNEQQAQMDYCYYPPNHSQIEGRPEEIVSQSVFQPSEEYYSEETSQPLTTENSTVRQI